MAKLIKSTPIEDIFKEAAEKGAASEKNFQETGLCQCRVEVSKDKYEPCTRQGMPDDPQHHCKECRERLNDLLEQLKDSQGPGDSLLIL